MGEIDDVRNRAVLLTDDAVGVTTENEPRKIQANGSSFYTHLSPSWLDTLNIAAQSAETLHSFSLGMQPVIVQQPAIIVQPAELVRDAEKGTIPRRVGSEGVRPW